MIFDKTEIAALRKNGIKLSVGGKELKEQTHRPDEHAMLLQEISDRLKSILNKPAPQFRTDPPKVVVNPPDVVIEQVKEWKFTVTKRDSRGLMMEVTATAVE